VGGWGVHVIAPMTFFKMNVSAAPIEFEINFRIRATTSRAALIAVPLIPSASELKPEPFIPVAFVDPFADELFPY
jgi:hypothetical protein